MRLASMAAAVVGIALAGLVGPVEAEQRTGRADPVVRSSSEASGLRKGAIDWSLIGGSAVPSTLFRAHEDRRLSIAAIDWGRVMTHQLGPKPFTGQLEVLLEAVPVFALQQPQPTHGFNFSPVFLRWNLTQLRHVQPFAEVIGGILVTGRKVPVESTRLNFTPQAGIGVRVRLAGDRALLIGYRFHHISNGGRVRPNPGVNSNVIYGGISFLR